MDMNVQQGILNDVPRLARYLTFSSRPGVVPQEALRSLAGEVDGDATVLGIGSSTVGALGTHVPGLRELPVHSGAAVAVPSTPRALWLWLRGDDRGELLHRSRALQAVAAGAFRLEEVIDAFQYGPSLDLTGYEDGTENPAGDRAAEVGIVAGQGPGRDGSSFVTVQQWVHNLDTFQAMPQQEQDHTIGRRKSDNEELDDAPASAHVKRTAQESFDPEAFVLRRSMPWADATAAGLVFVAFGRSLDAFEALLRRMVGVEDGVVDALFRFTRPVTGSTFWCPPAMDGRLDLSALSL
jgi:putative iron-dependent peroxidase